MFCLFVCITRMKRHWQGTLITQSWPGTSSSLNVDVPVFSKHALMCSSGGQMSGSDELAGGRRNFCFLGCCTGAHSGPRIFGS